MRSKFLFQRREFGFFRRSCHRFCGRRNAADLATKAPPAQAMPAWSGAGFYAGGTTLPFVVEQHSQTRLARPSWRPDSTAGLRASVARSVTNWQNGMWVYGLEG